MSDKRFVFDSIINSYSSNNITEQTEHPEDLTHDEISKKSSNDKENNKHNKYNPKKHNKLKASNISNIPNDPEKRKRGRPKRTEGENKSKHFNLLIRPSTLMALNRIAAKKQLATGNKISVTELINIILENYVKEEL